MPQAAAYITEGGLGCAKAHTAQTSPLSQLLYLRISLPSLQVIAAKWTNSSRRVKACKEERAPGPDGFTLPPAWTSLLCHRKADWPPDRGYRVSLQPQALPLAAGCAWEAWAAAHGDNTQLYPPASPRSYCPPTATVLVRDSELVRNMLIIWDSITVVLSPASAKSKMKRDFKQDRLKGIDLVSQQELCFHL